ncbi:MAG: ABC transporter permease [Bacteroidales bacterium]|nr:ABC transporter permease [Candidatus Sodaliphilus fimicaballi]
MKKLKLIIAREYKAMVMSKSFILTTMLMPLLIVVCGGVPALIGYLNDAGSDVEKVAIIDESGRYGAAVTDTELYQFVALKGDTASATNAREFYDKSSGDLAAVVVIPAAVDQGAPVTVYSESTVNISLKDHINRELSDTITRAKLASYGIEGLQEMIDNSTVDVDVKSVKWSNDGSENESSTEIAMVLGMVLSLFTYMFVLMYGAMIMNGVVEEKTNRIVEVIVSSCKPFQLMMGKILGIGLVGLTQIAVWTVLVSIVMGVCGSIAGVGFGIMGDNSVMLGGAAQQAAASVDEDTMASIMRSLFSVNYAAILSCFVLYFLGGYLLYASLFAACGSAVDQASDAGQFTSPLMFIMIIALYAGMACIDNPSGPMATACSMIPFTSPVVMMIRLPYDVPFWQILVSLLLLYATAAGTVWVASRIYRTGILLYGKKHGFKDLFKWVKG